MLVINIFVIIFKLPVIWVSLYLPSLFLLFLRTQGFFLLESCYISFNCSYKRKKRLLSSSQYLYSVFSNDLIRNKCKSLLFTPSGFSFVHGPQHCHKIFFSPQPFRGLPFFIADSQHCSWSKSIFPWKILISKMQHLNNQTLRNTQCLDSTKPTKRTWTAVQNLQAQYTAEEQLLRWLYLYLQHLANSVLQTHFVRLGNTWSR